MSKHLNILVLLIFLLTGCTVSPSFENGGAFCPVSLTEPEGGRDFLGPVHMVVTVNLRPSDTGRQILADVTMLAEKNSTTIPRIQNSFLNIPVYTLPSDTPGRITAINPSSGRAEGITGGAGPEFGICNDGQVFTGPDELTVSGVIEQIEVIGDTGAADISDDANCKCDSQIRSLILSNVDLTITE